MAETEIRIGQVYVVAKSRTGRRWEVRGKLWGNAWHLVPLAERGSFGRYEFRSGGGVRAISVPHEVLTDPKRWRRDERSEGVAR
jgi:hypothetical protein